MKPGALVVAATLVVFAAPAGACGPFFPADLLGDRAGSLANLPEGAFAFEAQRLVSPAPHWVVVEHADWMYPPSTTTRASIEQAWWGDRYERVDELRREPSAAAVLERGKGLPEEVLRYMAGSVAFAHDDETQATRYFRAVLELPQAERAHYGVWAQYMLGKIEAWQGNRQAAGMAFKATRDLVAGGAADPLGLAATSLGNQAALHLAGGDDAGAIALYAEQAAAGSEFGRTSLLAVARDLTRDEARLDRALADPLAQRLVTAYLFTRSGELGESPYDADVDPRASSTPPIDAAAKIAHVLDAIERAGLQQVAGADRVAALAYRNGRYELAQKFAEKDGSGLAWWVRAKLALRRGDLNAASQAYARAARSFPADETWGTPLQAEISYFDVTKPQCRVTGEQGIVALARGEYLAAMQYLYNATNIYWVDAAYIADRVLTVDELKGFVDAHVSVAPAARKAADGAADEDEPALNPRDTGAALRALLARRLLRVERYDEALRYFDDAALRGKAQAYVGARRAAIEGDRIERARAWFDAATAARFDGMDLLGYELAPDFQDYGGNFSWGYAEEAKTAKPAGFPIALVGADEAARTSASTAQPPQRFHYRYGAAQFAGNAADLLPPRSQAFAAVLCHATGWLLDRDPDAAQKIYRRYIKQGPHVAWAQSFGQECPAPDFPAAARRLHAERVAHMKHFARHSLPYAATALGLLCIAAAWAIARRRRHPSPDAPASQSESG